MGVWACASWACRTHHVGRSLSEVYGVCDAQFTVRGDRGGGWGWDGGADRNPTASVQPLTTAIEM